MKDHRIISRMIIPKLTQYLGLLLALLLSVSSLAQPSRFNCLIEPYETVDLGTSVPGVIDNIRVGRSARVQAGQALVSLAAPLEEIAVEIAQEQANLRDQIETMSVRLDYAQRKFDRSQELYKNKVIPFHLLDEAETELRIATLDLRQARNQQRLAKIEITRARQALALRTIHSPITGVVVKRFKSVGEFVKEQPIMRLAQLDPLRVEVVLPLSMHGQVTTNMDANVFPEIPLNGQFQTYTAKVEVVDQVIDAASATFGVRLILANPEQLIPGGLGCKIEFPNLHDFTNDS